ncbi:MAG: hypothetical protein AAFX55_20555 [Bacteroidota bacterium]
MTAEYSSKNSDLRDILSFEKIDFFRINFTGTELVGKDYSLIAKEIWNGKVSNIDTLVNTSINQRLSKLSKDTLSFKVIAKK